MEQAKRPNDVHGSLSIRPPYTQACHPLSFGLCCDYLLLSPLGLGRGLGYSYLLTGAIFPSFPFSGDAIAVGFVTSSLAYTETMRRFRCYRSCRRVMFVKYVLTPCRSLRTCYGKPVGARGQMTSQCYMCASIHIQSPLLAGYLVRCTLPREAPGS